MADVAATRRLILSAREIGSLTGWPDAMIEDYVEILRDLVNLSQAVGGNDGEIKNLQQQIDDLSERVDLLEVRVAKNEDDIADLEDFVIEQFQHVAYGGLNLLAGPIASADIDSTWQTITAFDSVLFSTPVHIVQDLAGSALEIDNDGVYEMVLTVSIEHNDQNSGRKLQFRVYNVTDAEPEGNPVTVYVARNQNGSFMNIVVPFDMDVSDINDSLVVQVSSPTDTFTSVSYDTCKYYIKSIGEWRE